MPRQPSHDPGHLARLYLSQVPEAIRKSITNEELNDRVIEAVRLGAQANNGALSPELRRAARLRAGAVLAAQPRATTRQQHGELVAKAAACRNPAQAVAIRRAADQLLEQDHPIAPTRTERVRKAKAESGEGIVAVFDADGNMVGICDPDDITPVAGKQATPAAPAALAGEPVAKSQRLSVWDVNGRRYVTTRGKIRKTAEPRPGVYDDGPLYRVLDDSGWGTGVASPAEQARRGTVRMTGTTGLGLPRRTGPAEALPGDGPQATLPGAVEGRTIIKSLGPQWRAAYDSAGRLRGAVRQQDVHPARPGQVLKAASAQAWDYVHNHAGRLVGIAPAARIIPRSELRAAGRVAKALGR